MLRYVLPLFTTSYIAHSRPEYAWSSNQKKKLTAGHLVVPLNAAFFFCLVLPSDPEQKVTAAVPVRSKETPSYVDSEIYETERFQKFKKRLENKLAQVVALS